MKPALTYLVATSVIWLFVATPAAAQTNAPSSVQRTAGSDSGLKASIADAQRLADQRSASVDVKALDKLDRQTPKKHGLTTKQKTWIVIGAIAFAALIFVVIKYGKDCIKSDPAGCTPGVDEPCTCLEYAKNK